MNLLLVGNIHSVFISSFTDALKKHCSEIGNLVRIDIVNTAASKTNQSNPFDSVYNYVLLSNNFIERIPVLRGVIRRLKFLFVNRSLKKNLHIYDCIIIHGVWEENIKVIRKLPVKNQALIASMWGGDIFELGFNQKTKEGIDKCDLVTGATDEIIESAQLKYNIDSKKIRKCKFGLLPLENIYNKQDITIAQAKESLSIPSDCLTITCGYSRDPNQYHLKIIDYIKQIENHLPKNYVLLFPLTYGYKKAYITEVEEKVKNSCLNARLFTEFMSNDNVALLRKATDIFIQVQKSDTFSGSTQEHLMAGSILITGSWLPYGSLKSENLYFETINTLDELPYNLTEVVNNLDKKKTLVKELNTIEKFNGSLWENAIKDWHNAIKEAIDKKKNTYDK